MGQIIPAFSRETREAIHAHGVRSDPRRYGPPTGCSHFFQSTIPEWGVTRKAIQGTMRAIISIHAPRVGSDCGFAVRAGRSIHFYPRSPRGERLYAAASTAAIKPFLSTLPAWGATCVDIHGTMDLEISIHAPRVGSDILHVPGVDFQTNFYPRSPRGERQEQRSVAPRGEVISIHAPRVGSDTQSDTPRLTTM